MRSIYCLNYLVKLGMMLLTV